MRAINANYLVAALAIMLLAGPAHAGQTWDIADALTGNAASTTLSSPWTLFERQGPICTSGGNPPINQQLTVAGQLGGKFGLLGPNMLYLAKNFSVANYVGPNGMIVPPGNVVLYPGSANRCLVLRFTVPSDQPSTGSYTFVTNFKGAYSAVPGVPPPQMTGVGNGDGVTIRAREMNGSLIMAVGSVVNTKQSGPSGAGPLNLTKVKSAGDWVEFAVQAGSNTISDATSLVAKVIGPDAIPNAATQPVMIKCVGWQSETPPVDISTGLMGWTGIDPTGSAFTPLPSAQNGWALLPEAQWVGLGSASAGTYTLERKIKIEKCDRGRRAAVNVSYLADNSAKLIIDGQVVKTQMGASGMGFVTASLTNHVHTFPASTNGTHSIKLEVLNNQGPVGSSAVVKVTR